jgi:hypothetical protein
MVVVVVGAFIQNMRADVCCVRPLVNGDSRIAAATRMVQGGEMDGSGLRLSRNQTLGRCLGATPAAGQTLTVWEGTVS